MIGIFKELQLIFEGTVVFSLLTQILGNFINHPSLLLIPEIIIATMAYTLYRLTLSLFYKSMEKISQAKKKKAKLEKRVKKKRGT